MRKQGLVPPMRRCRETTTSCRHTRLPLVKRTPGALHEKLAGSLSLLLAHGKLGSGELQVNSIVPPLTFGLFAPTLPEFHLLFLTCSFLINFALLFICALLLSLHLSDAWSVCMVSHLAHVHQAEVRIKDQMNLFFEKIHTFFNFGVFLHS